MTVDNAGAIANQVETGWAQVGQTKVAGRYRQGSTNFAPAEMQNVAPAYAQYKTERAPAANVSNKPVDGK